MFMAPHGSTQQRCTPPNSNMKPDMDSKVQNSESTTDHSNSEDPPTSDYTKTKYSSENRVPPMYEEEGTQTDTYNGAFFYGTSENGEQEPTTNVSSLNQDSRVQNPSHTSSTSQGREAGGSLSMSSGGHGTVEDSRVRWDFADDSSSLSESGESVIERLSKSVSRLLKPVIFKALIISILL